MNMVTVKQKRFIKNLAENGGNSRRAALAAGYSQEMADNPKKIFNSIAVKESCRDIFDPAEISKLHNRLVHADVFSQYSFSKSMPNKEIVKIMSKVDYKIVRIIKLNRGKICYFLKPDNQTRLKAIDMAYKVTGTYNSSKLKQEDPLAQFSNEELYDLIRDAERSEKFIREERLKKRGQIYN